MTAKIAHYKKVLLVSTLYKRDVDFYLGTKAVEYFIKETDVRRECNLGHLL